MATKKKSAALPSIQSLIESGYRYQPNPEVDVPVDEAPAERSWGAVAKDVGISALKGAIAVPEAAVGIADLVSGGRVGKFLENEDGAIGFRPERAKAMLDEGYSDKQKGAFERVRAADGFVGTLKEAVSNPSVVAHTIVESLPSMGAGGVLARGAMKLAPGIGGVVAAAGGEGVVGAGSAAEQIRQQTDDGLLTGKQAGLAVATGAATTGFSMLGGKIAQKLGLADVDTLLAGATTNPAAGKGVVRMALEGALAEGLLEELPQSVSETVMQNIALDRPLDEGVDQAAVLGLLSGAAMGGGVNAVNGLVGPGAAPAPVAAPPSGPLGRAAGVAPPVVAPPEPAPLPKPEPATAQALLDHANKRAAELDAKAKGAKEQKTKDEKGNEVVTPAVAPQFLTPEEKEEQKFLKESGGDAARLAQVYPEVVPQGLGASVTGTDLGDMLAPADNPLLSNGRAIVADREGETRMNKALARMERDAGRELNSLREFAPAARGAEEEPELDTYQPGDILNPKGEPFKNKLAANNAQRKNGGTVVTVSGGFVVRPAAAAQEPANATAKDAPVSSAGQPLDQAAAPAVGADAGTGFAAARAGEAVQDGQPEQSGALTAADSEWKTFAPETNTLNIPRAEMPQIKAEHRGAMVNFLNARGVEHEADEVDPATLKPTQAEFSTAKVEKARGFSGTDRSILVSADGHVVDGHHQWLARGENGQPVKVIRLKAPIAELLPLVREFPSSSVDESSAAAPTVETPPQDATPVATQKPADVSDNAAPATTKLPMASKEDAEHLFGVDKKRKAAIDRIAKGTAYFSTAEKAGEFIKKSGLTETHEHHEPKPGRFEVRAKADPVEAEVQAVLDSRKKNNASGQSGEDVKQIRETALQRRDRLKVEREKSASPAPAPASQPEYVDEAPNGIKVSDRVSVTPKDGRGQPFEATVMEIQVNAAPAYGGTAFHVARDDAQAGGRGTAWYGIESVAKIAAAPAAPAAEKPKGIVGRRADGVMIREDDRGVRYYTEGGVRIEETVTLRPTRQGMQVARGELKPEFMTAEESAAAAPAKDPAPAVSANTIFTEDAAEKARARLKAKLGRLNSGVDPEMLMDGLTLAGYHIERGARTFSAFARAMVADLGDGVKPFLKSWYMGIAFDPRAQAFTGMDDVASVAGVSLDAALGDDGSSINKKSPDSVSMVSDLFGDGTQRQALIEKGFEGAGVDVQQRVLAQMRSGLLDLDVRRAVVEALPGDVMRMLIPREIPTALLLRNETVLVDALTVPRESPVPVPVIGVVDALVAFVKRKGALPAAEVKTPGGNLGRATVGAGAALGATDGGQGVGSKKRESTLVQSDPQMDNLGEQPDTGDEGNGNAAQQLDRASEGALAGAPAQDVRPADQGGDTGAGADGSGRGDGGGNARADDAGGNAGRGVGSNPGAVPVPSRGTGANAQDAKKRRVPRAARTEQGDGLFGPAGGLTPDTGANPAPNAPAIAAPQPSAQDFTITDELALGEGGQKTKFKDNVAAIRLVRELEASGRMATPDEQAVLAKYVGWGGLPQAFDERNTAWAKEFAEISELMSPEELAAARQSTRYAHYTSREIVQDGIYAALRHFGFTGGKTLEAGAGVGNFIGLMPADMRSAGRFTAIEREPFSSAIARNLYPQQSVQQADFTEFKGTDAYFDAAVGNPPFASDPQTDKSGRKHLSGLSLHNYFFAKSIDMLREGGILAQVVTNSFMDAKGDRARKYISDRVEFLGAIRLPNSAFAKNANTEVTTDLIFLKKRPDGEVGGKAAREDAKRWLNTGIYRDSKGRAVALNQYFIDNPSMMLGDFGAHGTMYGPDQPALIAKAGQDTAALLKEAVGKLPAGVYKSIAETGTDSLVNAAVVALKNPSVKEGGFFIEGGKLMQRLPDIAGEARGVEITPASQWTAKTTLGESGFERIKALAEMRSTVRGLIAAEMADDGKAMETLRAALNKQYDAYRDTHGLINDPSTLRVFDDDPDFPLLASLEHGYTPAIGPVAAKRMNIKPTKSSAKKGPIFTQRVVAARQAVQKVETPADALAVSMAERGRLDAAYIGQLLGMEPEAVLRELSTGDKPLLFRDPATDEYVLRDAYLSGNVRAKLAQAKEAGMFANVTALEAVQPPEVGSHEIVARLGSPWVPTAVYRDFAVALFGEDSKVGITYLPANSSFQLAVWGGSDVALTNTWGTKDYPGDALLQAVMNNRQIKVTYRTQDGKTHTDVDATERANAKAQEVRDKFTDWLFSDPERSELLTKAYNETNNNYVTRVYDGSHMTFPGKVPDSVIKFRRHQRNAIARGVYDRTALLDHVVGAGKTFTVIATAMELKRTGLARKPMVAVPNHLVKQWAADFYRLYPGANVLTATKKDFEKANRRKFLAKIATGDWDAVVIAHSSYGFIKPSPEFEATFNSREVKKIMATIKSVEEGDGEKQTKRRTVKQLEAMKERLENRIKALRDKPMDDLLDFEQIGVDQLFVDEAHLFKNLMFTTKMQGVAGLNDPSGSQRAYDMYVKTNQVMEKNGRGQGVIFATGTPVSNSLAEMYHMMRYLMPAQMAELGFESFDAWANTYASVEQVWMQAPSGDGFKAQNRMSNFVNTPELMKMFDQVSDTVTMEDIKTAYREENDGAEFPLPKLKGGRRTPVSLEKSAAQNAYMESIAARAKAIEARKGPPQKGDDNILVVMSDARKAAIDIRLVDPDATVREPGGRIDRATDEVLARYQKYNAVKGTQIVFSDLGTPLKHAKKELAEYEALQGRILAGTEDVAASATLGNEAAMGIMEDAEAAQAELDAMGPDWLSAVKAAIRGFSVYDDFKAALIEKGIPEAEIAFIHDYNTDDQKAGLFRKVNAGQIRVLLGSTAKLGAGTNVQERLVAEHHLDVPWRPSDVEQREGRIERQGNRLMTEWPDFEIEILAYVTRDTLDMRMWQVQETKLKMINQLRTRKIGREIDNAFEDMELSAGEMQAAATGDINLLKEIQLRNDVKKLEQKRRAFDGQKNDLISRKKRNAEALRALPAQLAEAEQEARFAAAYFEDARNNRPAFKMNIDGKDYTDAAEAQAVLRALDEKTEEHKALNGEVTTKKAPLSVTINGELVKNRATMAELFSEARGDVDGIAWTHNGETYRRRATLATGIRARVLDAIADETVQQVGAVGAYSVAVEGSNDRNGNPMLEVTLRRDGDVKLSNSFNASDSSSAPARVISQVENLLDGAVSEAGYLDRQLKRAQREAAELEKVEVAGAWPEQAKLDAAREAHKAVLAQLKKKDGAAPGAAAEALSIDVTEGQADTEDHAQATQAHRDAAAAVAKSLTARRNAAGGADVVLDAVAPGQGPRGRTANSIAAVARRLFAREVVYVRFEGKPLFNGLVSTAHPNKIFLNIDSKTPFMAVLGHELLHEMAKSTPGIYKALSMRLDKVIKGDGVYAARLKRAYAAQGIGTEGVDIREELEADIVGDNFMDPEFWAAMAEEQPGLFKRVVNAIVKWLDMVAEKLGKQRPFGTDAYLADIAAARAAVADSMRQFSAAEAGAVADPTEGDAASVAAPGETLSIAADDVPPNDPRPAVAKARDVVSDLFNAPGKLNWWHKTVGTQYNLAQRSAPFKRVFDRVQDFLNDVSYHATQAADLAPNILPKLDSWRDVFRSPVSAEDNKAIAAPIFEGTLAWRRDETGAPIRMSEAEAAAGDLTTEQKAQRLLRGDHVTERMLKMWRALPIEQYETIIENKFERDMLAAGVVWSDSELVDIFKLTPAQISLYREFRAATDKSLSTLAVSDMVRFGGSDVAAVRDEAMEAPDANVAATILRDHLLELADMNPDRREVLIDTANKMIEKADKVQGLMDRGYAPLSRFGHYSLDVVDADGQRVYFGLFESKAEASKMARAMRANFEGATIRQGTMSEEAYKLFAGVSPETLELFGGMLGLEADGDGAKDKAFQEYLKLAKGNRSAMKRLIQRKGVAGFSEDAGRVLAGFVYSNARQTATGLHMGAIAEAANDIPQGQGELKDAALKLMDYIKNPVEEAAAFRGLLFAQYLGGSLASAMVNMTQPVAVTMPYLSQFGGVRAAAGEMKSALADVFKKATGDAKLDAALKKAEEDGIVAPQEVHQLMAQAQGKATLQSGDGTAVGDAKAKASNAMSKVSLAWGKAFGAAEQFNRRVTFIASYRLAVKQGMADPAAFAEKTIAETQFVYNKGNKPRWARGAVGGTIFTFKQYSISYMELLTRMAASGPEGKKAALMAVGILFLMGGAGGLPFVEDIEDVLDGVMQRLGYNFSAKQKRKEFLADLFGKEAAQFLEQGVSGLPGAPIDISGRMGLGNLIPGTGLLLKKPDYSRDIVDAVGPAGDLIRRGFQSVNALAAGEVGEAATVASPVAVRNVVKAVDMANTGMYRDDRGRKVLDVDGYDALAKAIGFQPNDVAQVQEGSFAAQKMISLNKITEADIAGRWAVGLFEGDQKKVAAAREAMLEWNRKNPESPIKINMGQVLKRVRAMRATKEERIAATAPREIRANVRRELMAE